MNQFSRFKIAQEAAQVIIQNNINLLPVDPLVIAENHDILVMPKPGTSCGGVSGMLCRLGNNFGIMYATHIRNDGFQRFSIAHELGHYFLPGHIDAIGDVHESHAGRFSSDEYEIEADHFAAELLMPKSLFCDAIKISDHGLSGIKHLSKLCRTSLTSTAIQYIQYCDIPAAIIFSKEKKVDSCWFSKKIFRLKGLKPLKKGQFMPSQALAIKKPSFNISSTTIPYNHSATANINDWFGGRNNIEFREEMIRLGNYGKTLTVLTPLHNINLSR